MNITKKNDLYSFLDLIRGTKFFLGETGSTLDSKYDIARMPRDEINWSVRFKHVLDLKTDIITIGDLLNTDFNEMLRMRNCGNKSIIDARTSIIYFVMALPEEYKKIKHEIETSSSYQILNIQETSEKLPLKSLLFLRKWESSSSPLDFSFDGNDNPHISEVSIQRQINNEYPLLFYIGLDANKVIKYFDMKLSMIDFPKRMQDFIEYKKLITLQDLLKINIQELCDRPNLGQTSINRGFESIKDRVLFHESKLTMGEASPPIQILSNLLDKVDIRTREIILMRWGNEKVRSLEEIGEQYKISRERVRQIIFKFIHRANCVIRDYKKILREKFLAYIVKQISAIKCDFFNEDYQQTKYSARIYLGILSEIFEEVPFFGFIPQSIVQKIRRDFNVNSGLKSIILFLDITVGKHVEITPQRLVELMIQAGFDISKQLLCFKVIFGHDKYILYKNGEGRKYLIKKGGIRDLAYNLLRQSDQPLNIESILHSAKDYFGIKNKYESLTSVISNIKQDMRIIQFDKYKFGVETHFSYPKRMWKNICQAAKIFLSEKRRQTYVTEILERVSIEFPLIKSKYELVHILRYDPEIRDLGFFNFTLSSIKQKDRIKVTELIKTLYTNDPTVKHSLEIREKLKENRYIRDEGIGTLLKSQDYLESYLGSFYGLKDRKESNNRELSKTGKYITYLIDRHCFPYNGLEIILSCFETEELKQNAKSIISSSPELCIYTLDNSKEIVINKRWSIIKLIKCLLSNLDEPIFEEQIIWMLKDLGKPFDKNDLYKLRSEKGIIYSGQKYSLEKATLISEELISVLDECFNYINDSAKSFSIDDLYQLIKNYLNEEVEYSEFVSAIKEDDRFIVLENKLVLIK